MRERLGGEEGGLCENTREGRGGVSEELASPAVKKKDKIRSREP